MIDLKKKSVYKKIGRMSGKTITIMCWVHGNETHWISAVNRMIENLEIDNGIVYFIYANVAAIEKKKRFIEKNMNRCFYDDKSITSYEEERVLQILPYLQESDYLLDLHSSNSDESEPFLITEHCELKYIFPVKKIVSGFDVLQPWWSDEYMNKIGKKGLCLESWSIKDNNIKILKEAILNFLKYTGNIDWVRKDFGKIKRQKDIQVDTLYKNNIGPFILHKEFADFEEIKSGDLIWYDWWKEIIAKENGIILFARNRDRIWEEAFILWKYR